MIDRATRWPEYAPLTNITDITVAKAFLHVWIVQYGVSTNITSVRGDLFHLQHVGSPHEADGHQPSCHNSQPSPLEWGHRTLPPVAEELLEGSPVHGGQFLMVTPPAMCDAGAEISAKRRQGMVASSASAVRRDPASARLLVAAITHRPRSSSRPQTTAQGGGSAGGGVIGTPQAWLVRSRGGPRWTPSWFP